MKKILIMLLVTVFVLSLLTACGTDKKDKTSQADGSESVNNHIKDYLQNTEDSVLLDIASGYLFSYSFEENFNEDAIITYDKAFQYMYYSGVFGGNDPENPIKPELQQYFEDSTQTFTIPADIVDEYLVKKFNTICNRSLVTEYDSENDVYVFVPYMGDFYYSFNLDQRTETTGNTIIFSCSVTGEKDVWGEDAPSYTSTFIIRVKSDIYTLLSVETKQQ